MTRTTILVALALVLGGAGLLAVAPAASAAVECSDKIFETNCWKYGEGMCHQYIGVTDTCIIWT